MTDTWIIARAKTEGVGRIEKIASGCVIDSVKFV